MSTFLLMSPPPGMNVVTDPASARTWVPSEYRITAHPACGTFSVLLLRRLKPFSGESSFPFTTTVQPLAMSSTTASFPDCSVPYTMNPNTSMIAAAAEIQRAHG